MPAAVIGAVVSAGLSTTAFGATVLFGSLTVAGAIGTAASLVVGSAQARRAERKQQDAARRATIASLRDVQSVVRSAVQPINIVYGRALVGGTLACWFTRGDVGQFHHWTQTLAGHPIDAVEAYYLNDDLVTLDGNGFVTTPKYCAGGTQPLIRIRPYLGTQTTLDPELVTASNGAFTSADAGQGTAYLYVRFEADYDVFGQTGVPNIRAVIRGAKVFDPRTATTVWSDNAALCARDYLTQPYGLRCLAAEVNDADTIAAANLCDEAVAIVGGTQTRYTCNGALLAATNLRDNLEALVDSMAGLAVWSQGQWRIKAGAYEAPVRTITVDDIVQVEEVVAFTPRREIFNTVTGTFVDPANLYAEKQFPVVTNPTYVAQDAGQSIERQLALPLCNDATRAQRMAKAEIERARQAVTISILAKWRLYDLTPGDHVALTIARYGFASKVFFVAKRELSADGIRYVLRETAPQVWAWNLGDATTVDPAPNTDLPDPYLVPAIAGLSASSGTAELLLGTDGSVASRIRAFWTAVANQYVQIGGRIEVQFKRTTDADWTSQRIDGDQTATYLTGVEDGVLYQVRARAINVSGQRGVWSEIEHTVIGKTEPPPDVGRFTINGTKLSWDPVQALDLAGYVLRFQYGTDTFWPSAGPLHAGVITETPYDLVTRPTGPVTLLIKAVDTSGNESVNAASITANLGDALVENVWAEWPQAPTFPGQIVGGTLVAGDLVADGADAFYGDDLTAFYGPDTADFYEAATFAQLRYDWSVTPDTDGRLLLLYDVGGTSFTIEFNRNGQAPFYGLDGDPFYGPDPDPFYDGADPWVIWPGEFAASEGEEFAFRITVASGAQQGVIRLATPRIDVPDVREVIEDLVISSGGTRLPLTKTFRVIKSVLSTVQTDGNGGVTPRTVDKNPSLGPLMQVLNASGTAVTGLLDAEVQGY